MNRVLAILWKDLRLFFGDRKAMLITFLVPIGIASFFGYIFGNASSGPTTSKKIPVLVVDHDCSPLVADILNLGALGSWTVAAALYPLYLFTLACLLVALMLRPTIISVV